MKSAASAALSRVSAVASSPGGEYGLSIGDMYTMSSENSAKFWDMNGTENKERISLYPCVSKMRWYLVRLCGFTYVAGDRVSTKCSPLDGLNYLWPFELRP